MARTALITGAARRLGAATCKALHRQGFNIIVHYKHSQVEADKLAATLNNERPGSACTLQADLSQPAEVASLARQAIAWQEQLDLLVNNASRFYPNRLDQPNEDHWPALINTNLRAPFILCQALAPALRQQKGSIINLVDIYAEKPLRQHSLYSISKAGIAMLTYSMARELGPDIRVNGVAPGVILAPESAPERLDKLLGTIPLERSGKMEDIANTIVWLATEAGYVNGQIIRVDGGRSLAFAEG